MNHLLTPADFDHDFMLQAQATNLQWCEAWGASLPTIAGVPVGRAFVYDLIQLLNRATVEGVLNAYHSLEEQLLPEEIFSEPEFKVENVPSFSQ